MAPEERRSNKKLETNCAIGLFDRFYLSLSGWRQNDRTNIKEFEKVDDSFKLYRLIKLKIKDPCLHLDGNHYTSREGDLSWLF